MELHEAKALAEKLNIELCELQYGYQYIFRSYKITVYPWGKLRNRKYHVNATNVWLPYTGDDEAIIDKYLNPKPIVIPEGFEVMDGNQKHHPKTYIGDVGTMACIEHVERKLHFYLQANENNETRQAAVVMKSLIQEFTQYL